MSIVISFGKAAGFQFYISKEIEFFRVVILWVAISLWRIDLDDKFEGGEVR